MDENIEEKDREALASMSMAPAPPRKIHSYSQQLRGGTGHKRNHQTRNYSVDEIDRYYNSDDEDFFLSSSSAPSSTASSQRLDQSLVPNSFDDQPRPSLPEFIGSCSDTGIFKVPTRAPVHPGRPACLELRPHPLRETQVGKFLRTFACTDTHLWAGQESGVRVWNFENAYEPGCGLGGRIRRGDEDAAPFYESVSTSPTICLIIDDANKLVWTGHKDGKIRSWKMDQTFDDSPFKEGLSWSAHRGPVLSMVITSYGDLWSGGEGGVIKIWPWESLEKSLSLSSEERHMAALLVERSFIDLRSQVTVNGVCNISSSDVKCLLADTYRAKVWCAGPMSFSLWDACTKELLKVFNTDGQMETRVDMSTVQEQAVEDEMKVKFVSQSKKEKSGGFLQRSRNAIMGAADAVRRVATKGAVAFQEETKKTEALLVTADGMIYSGCNNGLIVQWDGNGNRLQDYQHHPCAVQCFCTFGTKIWVGYVSGMIQVLDLEGKLLAGWLAHNSPVIKLAIAAGNIYSLATHGGIRGWSITSPGPIDTVLRTELAAKEMTYTRHENIKILVGTWNVGQGKPVPEALTSWLGSAASEIGIVAVGLQEVDMGAGFLAMSAAKETVGLEGSAIGQSWIDSIGRCLDEGKTFERLGSRQLAGLLIATWVRKSIRTHVGDVDAAAVACGFGRAIGNKGAVGLRVRVYDRIICFVNCHYAAHLEAVNRRNADFDHVYRTMAFSRGSNLLNAAAGVTTSAQMLRGANIPGVTPEETRPEFAEADMFIIFGDFNYRLFGISYDEARDFVSQRCFDWLREKDQLRAEMKAGRVFQGLREAIIRFPPTYKFERHRPGLGGYDSGEKKRIPAWCDRILYRDSRSQSVSQCSLECPVVASIYLYEACMDVTESDHKPVRCKLNVNIARVDRSVRRKEFGMIIKSNEKVRSFCEELHNIPETIVSTDNIMLQNQDTSIFQITNKSEKDKAVFQILCEGQSTINDAEVPDIRPRGSFGFPRWLEVTPAAGVIQPDQVAEVSVHHEEFHTLEEFVDGVPQNWWCEDMRDKEVILLVIVRGSCSVGTTIHRVRVRHCFSNKTIHIDSTKSRQSQGSSTHQSELPQPGNSSTNPSDDILKSS